MSDEENEPNNPTMALIYHLVNAERNEDLSEKDKEKFGDYENKKQACIDARDAALNIPKFKELLAAHEKDYKNEIVPLPTELRAEDKSKKARKKFKIAWDIVRAIYTIYDEEKSKPDKVCATALLRPLAKASISKKEKDIAAIYDVARCVVNEDDDSDVSWSNVLLHVLPVNTENDAIRDAIGKLTDVQIRDIAAQDIDDPVVLQTTIVQQVSRSPAPSPAPGSPPAASQSQSPPAASQSPSSSSSPLKRQRTGVDVSPNAASASDIVVPTDNIKGSGAGSSRSVEQRISGDVLTSDEEREFLTAKDAWNTKTFDRSLNPKELADINPLLTKALKVRNRLTSSQKRMFTAMVDGAGSGRAGSGLAGGAGSGLAGGAGAMVDVADSGLASSAVLRKKGKIRIRGAVGNLSDAQAWKFLHNLAPNIKNIAQVPYLNGYLNKINGKVTVVPKNLVEPGLGKIVSDNREALEELESGPSSGGRQFAIRAAAFQRSRIASLLASMQQHGRG